MEFKEIAKRLSGIVGTRVSPESLQRFFKPLGRDDRLVEIARQGKVILSGQSYEGKYNSRKTGENGPGYDVYFRLEGRGDTIQVHRGYLLEENSPKETVRKASEQLIRIVKGDFSIGVFKDGGFTTRGREAIHHSNVI